jgi:hypothetical protein
MVLTWAPVVSAAAGGLAAVASWRSVLQSRRLSLQGLLPELAIEVTEDITTGRTDIHIENAGSGIARRVMYYVVDGDEVTIGGMPFIRAGEGATLETGFVPKHDKRCQAVVMCDDREGRVQAWSNKGGHRSWKRRRWPERPKGGLWSFDRFFSDVNHDALDPVTSQRVKS